jgi:hypothetical protein
MREEEAPGRLLIVRRVGRKGDEPVATRRRLEVQVGELEWERLALTDVQVRDYDLSRLAIPKEDRRYRRDSSHRLHDAIETEALSQRIIVGILRDRHDELLPEPLEDVLEREQQERDELLE